MNDALWRQLFHRPVEANKYDFGHVLIVGGSPNMTGAPILAARSVLRVGAGLVTVASTAATTALIDRDIEEVMTLALPDWARIDDVIAALESFIAKRRVNVVAIGPGLSSDAQELIRELLVKLKVPVVLDALCFTALSGHLEVLKQAASHNQNLVLTPHTGEFERILSRHLPNITTQQTAALEFAKDYDVTVVVKHDHTYIVSPQGEQYSNTTGNAGLATAGSGDVLTGCIAGLMAQHIPPFEAAKMATYIHGMAGDLMAANKTEPGMIASDIIEALPVALRKIERSLN